LSVQLAGRSASNCFEPSLSTAFGTSNFSEADIQRSGSAVGRAADRPLQRVVSQPGGSLKAVPKREWEMLVPSRRRKGLLFVADSGLPQTHRPHAELLCE